MREIGGYIELEHYKSFMLHSKALALNCARNALAYLIEAKNIRKIAMPFFMCDSCNGIFGDYQVTVRKYNINEKFIPLLENANKDEWIYIVNFYGQLDNDILEQLKEKYENIIVDNTQSYFQMPLANTDTLYSCRKYFGVADGAFLYTNKKINRELGMDESYNRMEFLLGRFERSASEFYDEYVKNNEFVQTEPIKKMSKLTSNLLKSIDYKRAGNIRTLNFEKLHNTFKRINKLELTVPYGAFMYPLYIENGIEVRKRLVENKIYIPVLWPNVLKECEKGTLEYEFAANILPLPIDQRYGRTDMEYMEGLIIECIG